MTLIFKENGMATDREQQLLLEATSNGITSQKELANFMAQVTQESTGLTHLEEGFRYTHDTKQITEGAHVRSALREGQSALESARVDALNGKPEKLAELMYGGRMGNDEPGDGYKYRGRGYIQLTGKAEYEEAGKALKMDLVKNPDLAAQPENASKIATFYWNKHVHDKAPEDVVKATHLVNNGENGLDNRKEYFAQWQQALTPNVMDGLSKGEVRLPPGPVIDAGHHTAAHHHAAVAGNLKQGSHGEQVQKLQAQLGELGYLDNTAAPDGKFGPATRDAVKAYQHDHHLPEVGQAGPATQKAIQADLQPLRQDNAGPLPAVSAMSSLPANAPGLDDPRNALNPHHALYSKIQQRMPDASDQRLLQFTAVCHSKGITDRNLTNITFDQQKGIVSFAGTENFAAKTATLDVKIPSPPAAQSIQHIQQTDQFQAQLQTNINATIAQNNLQGPQGPTPGGPGGGR
jgi:putative chitinase